MDDRASKAGFVPAVRSTFLFLSNSLARMVELRSAIENRLDSGLMMDAAQGTLHAHTDGKSIKKLAMFKHAPGRPVH